MKQKYTEEFIKSIAPFGTSHYVVKSKFIIFFRNVYEGTYDYCIYYPELKEVDNWYTKRKHIPYSKPELKVL